MPESYTRKRIVLFFLCAAIFFLGMFIGHTWSVKQVLTNTAGTVDITKVVNLYGRNRSDKVSFDQFWKVWDKVKEKYVNQPVDDVDLFYGAIEGMVAGLNDPYSVYFKPEKAEEFTKDLSGEFEGIGAEVGKKEEMITIIAPLPGSPAEKAGLKSGDIIFAIDGEDVLDVSVDEAIAKIRGKKGTPVVLTIAREGVVGTKEYSVIRDTINIPTVTWKMQTDSIVYLRVHYFNEHTWSQFDEAVKEIKKKNARGLILDLRSNPGGYLETSVQVASEWVPPGQLVLKEVFNNGKKNEYTSQGAYRFANMKTMVLVDEGTASGAEIVAGALQDYRAATIIGQKTYGKGSVQDFEILPDGSALKLTIAKWFTPNEQQIDKHGIVPDVTIELPVEEKTTTPKDLVLEKALEFLK